MSISEEKHWEYVKIITINLPRLFKEVKFSASFILTLPMRTNVFEFSWFWYSLFWCIVEPFFCSESWYFNFTRQSANKNRISSALLTLGLTVIILNSQCKEGARYFIFVLSWNEFWTFLRQPFLRNVVFFQPVEIFHTGQAPILAGFFAHWKRHTCIF